MSLLRKIRSIDIYIFIWFIYQLLGVQKYAGSGMLLMVLNVWSFFDLVMLHNKTKVSKNVIIFDIFTAILVLYGLAFWLFGQQYPGVAPRAYVLHVWASLVPFYTIYRASMMGKLTKERVVFWIIPFFIVAILKYRYLEQQKLELLMMGEDKEIVNNGGYIILALLPLCGFMKKRVSQVVAILVSFYFIFTSFKRGSMLIFAVCIVYYLYSTINSSRQKIGSILLFCILFYFMYDFLLNLLASSDMFQFKLAQTMEGDSSHRNLIFAKLWEAMLNADPIHFLFGYGAYATMGIAGIFAHNDWLEIFVDQGLVGVVIHAIFCWNLIMVCRKEQRGSDARLALGLFAIIYIMTTMFSMAFDRVRLYEMMAFAYFVAIQDNRVKYGLIDS